MSTAVAPTGSRGAAEYPKSRIADQSDTFGSLLSTPVSKRSPSSLGNGETAISDAGLAAEVRTTMHGSPCMQKQSQRFDCTASALGPRADGHSMQHRVLLGYGQIHITMVAVSAAADLRFSHCCSVL